MSLSLKPATEFTIPQLADLMTRSFEGYFVPVNITDTILLTMLRRDGIDLTASRIIMKDDEPSGLALIARRGWTSRTRGDGHCIHGAEWRHRHMGDGTAHRRGQIAR